MRNTNPWYNNNVTVIILLILVFPIGLFALWKNEKAPKALKIVVTLFFVLAIILYSNGGSKTTIDLKEEKRKQLFEIAYTSEQKIIKNLKDPSSYELIEKDYNFLNDTIYEIKIKYSATNSFGARIQNQYLKTGILKYNPADTSFTNIVKFEK